MPPQQHSLIPPGGGDPVSVSEDDPRYRWYLQNRWTEETPEALSERTVSARREADYPIAESVARAVPRGLTFGGSDALIGLFGSAEQKLDTIRSKEAHPVASVVTELGAGAVPTLFTGGAGTAGALSRASIPGVVERVGARVTALGAEGGTLARTAAAAGGAATEAGIQSVAQTAGDALLRDKDLDAEAFMGNVFRDASLGAGLSGAFGLGEKLFTRAQKLFPNEQITKLAGRQAIDEAGSTFTRAAGDGKQLDEAAKHASRMRRQARELLDPEAKRLADEARALRNDKLRAQTERAQASRDKALLSLERERTKVPGRRAKTPAPEAPATPQRALPAPKSPADESLETLLTGGKRVEAPALTAPPKPAATPDEELEALLGQSAKRIEAGETPADLARTGRTVEDEIEDAADSAVATTDPVAQELLDARAEMSAAGRDMHEGLAPDMAAVRALPSEGKLAKAKAVTEGAEQALPSHITAEQLIAALKSPTVNLERDFAYMIPRIQRYEAANARLVKAMQAADAAPMIPSGSAAHAAEYEKAVAGVADSQMQRAGEMADDLSKLGPQVAQATATDELAQATRAATESMAQRTRPLAFTREGGIRGAGPEGPVRGPVVDEAAQAAAADTMNREAMATIGLPDVGDNGAGRGLGEAAAEAGTALELLNAMGITGLSLGSLPVVGPLLRMYLLARTKFAAANKIGGRLGVSAETRIAQNAAEATNKRRAVVRSILGGAAKVSERAQRMAPQGVAVLHRAIFSDDTDRKRPPHGDDLTAIWERRQNELERASMPGVLADSIRRASPSLNPDMQASLIAVAERQVAYLREKAPKPPPNWSIGGKVLPWRPPDSEMLEYARIVEAVRDPSAALARVAAGDAAVEQIEAIREVYPLLYREVQIDLITEMQELDNVEHERLVQIGTLFGIPLDPTQEPDFGARQQAGFAPAPPAQPAPPAGAQPSPGITAPITLSKSVAPSQGRAI
jgi:hypothetical protein